MRALPLLSLSLAAQQFDLAIANGRAIDPETNLDAPRHAGIRTGKVTAISRTPLKGATSIDATGTANLFSIGG